jgi:hypothetical protein
MHCVKGFIWTLLWSIASWMDGWIKNGRGKMSVRGSQIGPNVHHTDEKLKD